jgi:hypothetical protein
MHFASEGKNVLNLLEKEQQGAKRVSIVALLGYYSKGKSFVLNQLYNAGKAIPDQNWMSQWDEWTQAPRSTGRQRTTLCCAQSLPT